MGGEKFVPIIIEVDRPSASQEAAAVEKKENKADIIANLVGALTVIVEEANDPVLKKSGYEERRAWVDFKISFLKTAELFDKFWLSCNK